MSCKNKCKLCDRLVISQSVTFNPQGNVLVVGLPDGNYNNCEKYCIVIAQAIPAATTLSANVTFVIGTGTTQYPLLDCDCVPVPARAIRTRTRYATRVHTTPTTGSFKLLCKVCECCKNDNLQSIP